MAMCYININFDSAYKQNMYHNHQINAGTTKKYSQITHSVNHHR